MNPLFYFNYFIVNKIDICFLFVDMSLWVIFLDLRLLLETLITSKMIKE
jgi:hypothetical protein